MKKQISILLSVLMLYLSISMSFCAFAQDYPYVDEQGLYHRISDGADLAFETDYNKIVKSVREAIKNRENRIEFKFATTDTKYAYTYNSTVNTYSEKVMQLWKDIFRDVFTNDRLGAENAGNGDYLFKSIQNIGNYGSMPYLTSGDTPLEGNERYYPFYFKAEDIDYLGCSAWDEQVKAFAEQFGEHYLNTDLHPSMTEYMKVKTIYDYIVRNTEYDTDVFTGQYPSSSERYKIAHSAYGAVYGNNIAQNIRDEENNIRYFLKPKTVVSGEQIIESHDQGLAVCEGFSLLFCYLCNYFGVDCHIVDGDYLPESEKDSDPHEWNYVYLDDGLGDGYRWYQVDTTFAESKSYKSVDVNNYDYFLRGTMNINFGTKYHQQPYHYGLESFFNSETYGAVRAQLYTWDTDDCYPSARDYAFQKADISTVDNISQSVIFKRITDYGGEIGKITTFIYKNGAETKKIEVEVDKNGNAENRIYDVDGFLYNAHNAEYSAVLAYLVPGDESGNAEYETETVTAKNVKRDSNGNVIGYSLNVHGSGTSAYSESFKIIPLNMSNDAEYVEKNISPTATYSGKNLHPEIVLINDGYNDLQETKDFTLEYYNANGSRVEAPNAIGKYTIKIVFGGNHSGVLTSSFEVEKIKLSLVESSDVFCLPYMPEYVRKHSGCNGPQDYLSTYSAFGVPLKKGVDFTATSSDSLEYGSNIRYITISGISGSQYVYGGYAKKIPYCVTEKYDINKIGLSVADRNTTNKHYYTGKEIKPTKFDALDERLVQGKDYKIIGYENNVNVGDAYVIIQGINGCTGTLKLKFAINPASANPSGGGGSVGSGCTVVKQITLYTPSVSKLVAGKKRITVKWKPVKGSVTGYQIQYCLKKSFPKGSVKTVKVKGAKTASYTIKKLKGKKKYFVRIRTYYKYNGKTYTTPYSSSKAIKTK